MVQTVHDLSSIKQQDLAFNTQAERIHHHLGSILTNLKIYGTVGDVSFAFPFVTNTLDILGSSAFEKLAEFCNTKGMTCNVRSAEDNRPVLLVIEKAKKAQKAA